MQRTILCLLFGVLAISLLVNADYQVEPLTDDTWDAAISQYEILLAEFYAPWCGYCKKFAPEYDKIKEVLNEAGSPVKVYKISSEDGSNIHSRYGISSYPTINLFVHGHPIPYNGPRTEASVLEWVNIIASITTKHINSTEELNNARQSHEVVAAFWGDSSDPQFGVFAATAKRFQSVYFVYTGSGDIKQSIGASDTTKVTLIRSSGTAIEHYEGDFGDLYNWIDDRSKTEVAIFTQELKQTIFQGIHPALFLLVIDNEEGQQAVQEFKKAATSISLQIRMVIGYSYDQTTVSLLEHSGLNPPDVPAIRIFEPLRQSHPNKYRPDGKIPITEENILKFYKDYIDGKLSPYYKSQPIPEVNDDAIKIAVGDTFNDIVLDSTKDVFIIWYSPGCQRSYNAAPIFEEVGRKVSNVKNLVVARIDGMFNDVKGYNIDNFPAAYLFPAKNKENSLKYEGNINTEEIIDWLKSHATWAKWPRDYDSDSDL